MVLITCLVYMFKYVFNENDVWFLDSGCGNHMTGNKDLFSSIDTSIQSVA